MLIGGSRSVLDAIVKHKINYGGDGFQIDIRDFVDCGTTPAVDLADSSALESWWERTKNRIVWSAERGRFVCE